MPVIEVELPDGSIAEFPDDMAQDKISEAVQTHLKTQAAAAPGAHIAPRKPTWSEAFGEIKPAVTRGVTGAVGGLLEGVGALTTPSVKLSDSRSAYDPNAYRTADDEFEGHGQPVPVTPNQMADVAGNPAYQAGKYVSDLAKATDAPTSRTGKIAESAGGMIPLALSGPVAPVTIGVQALGETLDSEYQQAKSRGLSDEQASDAAIKTGFENGLTQAAIWAVLPGPIKKLLGKVTGLAGEGAVNQFVARRVAGAAEGATLGAASQAGGNIATGKPVGQNVVPAAVGMAGLGAATMGPERAPVLDVLEQAKAAGMPRAAAEAAKTLAEKGGETDASKNEETAEVHGDVREQPGQGQREVPKQVGIERIQPLGKEPETPADVVLKPPEIEGVKFLGESKSPSMNKGVWRFEADFGNDKRPSFAVPAGSTEAEIRAAFDSKRREYEPTLTADKALEKGSGEVAPEHIINMPDDELLKLTSEKDASGIRKFQVQVQGILWGAKQGAEALRGVETKAKLLQKDMLEAMQDPKRAAEVPALQQRAQFLASAAEGILGRNDLPGVRATYDALAEQGRIKPKEVSPNAKEEEKEGDEVLTPAVKTDEGVFSGQKRHNEIVLDQAKNGVDATGGERGFLHKGKFIDRAEAARIYEEQTGRKPANAGELHSEDLLDSGYFKEKAGQPAVVDQSVKKGGRPRTEYPPHPILDYINDEAGSIRLKSNAKAVLDQYEGDSYNVVQRSGHVKFSKTGSTPDQIIKGLQDAGIVGPDYTPDDLWKSLEGAVNERKNYSKGNTPEQKQQKFFKLLEKGGKSNRTYTVSAGDMQVGHKFSIQGESFEITNINPDNGELTVKDGTKFGIQQIPDGADFPVDKGSLKKPKEVAGFEPESTSSKAVPALRPGEKSGELFQGEDQPFNLAGETGTDAERIAAAKAKADKDKAEGAAISAKQQQALPIGAGPGAATRPGAVLQTDIGAMETNIPPLEKLADAVSRFPKQSGGGFRERLRQWMDDVGIPTKDFATRALVGAKAATANIVNAFTKLAKVTTMDRAVGDWNLADTEGDIAARRFAKAVKDRFQDRSKLRAFSNWINAGGDKELLQRQADLTKDPELKKTYTDALKFGPEEERLGSEIKQYHDEMLAEAMRAGALEEGLENYIHRYYPRETDPARQRLEGALNEMRFTKNFSGFKKRFYDSDFEAEQAGLKPEKDAAKRILAYDQGFRKALTARAFVKDRYKATMPDGRPEIDVTGIGVPSRTDVETGKETPYLVKPKSKAGGDSPEDYRGDYVTFDHPAFRRWKWVGQDANGKPILMEGEMAVHPDAVKKYRALFERSWFQKNPVTKALLDLNTFWKQTKLSLSAFHPVQIGEHALAHRVNPAYRLVDLNVRDPAQAELVRGGLVVSDLDGGNHFSEGVGGTGLVGKIPLAGEMLKASQDWLFKDYIPRIKMTMALDALKRNRERYSKQVASGKITDEQLVRLTARESNAAFGEQNYRAMFRNKSFQDVLRFAFLAPDFGESRLRFPIQALTRYGGEQRMALFLSAMGMFVAAKGIEKLLTGKMNLKKPFTVTVNNREYGLRNVASDLYHMITDPASYIRNRLSTYTRPVLEMLSGRDAFGRKRTLSEQLIDQAKDALPISARGAVEKDQSLWESFINAIGLTEHRASAFGQAMQAVNKWKQKKGYTEPGEFVYDADKDPYSKLTTALTYGSPGDARKQLDALTEGKTPLEARKIAAHYRRSLAEHPFLTGSRAHEQEYVKQLDSAGKAQYDEAKAERKAMWQKFVKAWRTKYPAATQ